MDIVKIDQGILNQIYMSQNCDAQPLKPDESQVGKPKEPGDKPLGDRVIVQIGDKTENYELASPGFRIGLYNFVKEQDSLKDELAVIRKRLNLTEKGAAAPDENRTIDTRSVINEVFARSKNVQDKVDAVLAGVVNFSEDVKKEICDAIWRQRDNPGIRKFLQSGGGVQDLAAICKLTLDSMEARGYEDFAHRLAMSYLRGFTLGTVTSSIQFSTEFEKSFEGDQLIRAELHGAEDRKALDLAELGKKEKTGQDAQGGAVDKPNEAKNKTSEDVPKEVKLDDSMKKPDKLVGKGIVKQVAKPGEKATLEVKKPVLPAKDVKPDFDKICGKAPQDPIGREYYKVCRAKFEKDLEEAKKSETGTIWQYQLKLKDRKLSADHLKKIWSGPDYYADLKAFNEVKAGKEPIGNKARLLEPKTYLTADGKDALRKNMTFRQQPGSNTCYMTSFVNGLLRRDEGVVLLKTCFAGDKKQGAAFRFPGYEGKEVVVKQADIAERKKNENISKVNDKFTDSYADFEWAAHIAYLKVAEYRKNYIDNPAMSEMQDQQLLAETFGYDETLGLHASKSDMRSVISAWTRMSRYMAATPDAICTVKTGDANGGHYMTVTGFYKTKNDFGVTVIDSMGRKSTLSMLNPESDTLSLHAYRLQKKAGAEQKVKGLVGEFSQNVFSCGMPTDRQRKIVLDVLSKSLIKLKGQTEAALEAVFLAEKPDVFGNVTFNVDKILETDLYFENTNGAPMDAEMKATLVEGALRDIAAKLLEK